MRYVDIIVGCSNDVILVSIKKLRYKSSMIILLFEDTCHNVVNYFVEVNA